MMNLNQTELDVIRDVVRAAVSDAVRTLKDEIRADIDKSYTREVIDLKLDVLRDEINSLKCTTEANSNGIKHLWNNGAGKGDGDRQWIARPLRPLASPPPLAPKQGTAMTIQRMFPNAVHFKEFQNAPISGHHYSGTCGETVLATGMLYASPAIETTQEAIDLMMSMAGEMMSLGWAGTPNAETTTARLRDEAHRRGCTWDDASFIGYQQPLDRTKPTTSYSPRLKSGPSSLRLRGLDNSTATTVAATRLECTTTSSASSALMRMVTGVTTGTTPCSPTISCSTPGASYRRQFPVECSYSTCRRQTP